MDKSAAFSPYSFTASPDWRKTEIKIMGSSGLKSAASVRLIPPLTRMESMTVPSPSAGRSRQRKVEAALQMLPEVISKVLSCIVGGLGGGGSWSVSGRG